MFLKSVVITGLLFSSPLALAQRAGVPNMDGASSVTGENPGAMAGANQMGINEAAAAQMAAAKAAAMQNMAVGAALLAAGIAGCNGTQTWGCPLIPMSALAFMQAGHDGNMGDLSGLSQDASINKPTGNGDSKDDTKNPTSPTGFTGKVKENLDQIADLGVTVDPKTGTVTTPTGTYPSSAFDSPASMAAAGMSAETIAAAQKAMADAGTGGASVGSMGLEAGGGGGGYGGGSSSSYGSGESVDYLAALRKGKTDKDRMVAGKSLTYGTDPIGVKMDNIFMMVHRRYQGKRKVNSYFLERAPASEKPVGKKVGQM